MSQPPKTMAPGLTIPVTATSLLQLYRTGQESLNQQHAEKEKDKVGILRGGNSGIIDSNGEVHGNCHRMTMLRYKGIDKKPNETSHAFFSVGTANEDIWLARLKESWPGVIKCEEEIPVAWTIPGTDKLVTGRPDMVLCDSKGTPQVGIEHKALAAVNSAVSVYIEDKPKDSHLIQAAHYSWQLGIPFVLVYTFSGQASMPFWIKPKPAEKNLSPFKKEFRLGWDNDKLYYLDSQGHRHDTPITVQGIVDYYSLVVEMAEKKKLYNRPASTDFNGNPLPYNPCNYCPMQQVCDDYEDTDFDRWLDEARKQAEMGDT